MTFSTSLKHALRVTLPSKLMAVSRHAIKIFDNNNLYRLKDFPRMIEDLERRDLHESELVVLGILDCSFWNIVEDEVLETSFGAFLCVLGVKICNFDGPLESDGGVRIGA